jgi:integrase
MPRRVPSYRHYKPKNLGLVVIDGRQFYLGRYGTPESVAEYNRLIQEWMTIGSPPRSSGTGGKPANPPAGATTVDQMILAFWKHAEVHYRGPDGTPTGEADNFREALRPVRRLYGHTRAAEFGPLALRTVRDAMVNSGLARTTINARVNRIRRVFKWAASHEIIPVAVVQGLATVSGLQQGRTRAPEPEKVKPVPTLDVEATLPHLPSPVAGMVRVQLATGCRAGEVECVRACDLTMTGSTWEYRPATHKTAWRGCDRVILLGPKAQAVIREFLKADPGAYLFDPADAVRERYERRAANRKSKRRAKPPTKRGTKRQASMPKPGQHYLVRSYQHAVARACRRAGVTPWSPLRLRHTAATLIRARFGLEAAQTVLGHAKADTTEIYAERDLAKAQTVMAAIG